MRHRFHLQGLAFRRKCSPNNCGDSTIWGLFEAIEKRHSNCLILVSSRMDGVCDQMASEGYKELEMKTHDEAGLP